ncbi:Glutathione S-transferase, C-terminal domain [Plasmodiophora brassicae]|uniref:Uncharacterized protein n=1 Tax=Plasmodiophora brassicae TaxID=37360 RepID=A0A3P3YIY7_PLABS|nr:unnamed protein product [Plasmodiophora brassicae]
MAKASLPSEYVVPGVWSPSTAPGGAFGGINRPTAGARSEAILPVGQHALQLYSLGTPNGQKVAILLEELGLDYDAWRINIMAQEQFTTGFTAVNPNQKIPAMMDRSATPPIRVFESVSIMIYLAEKAKSPLLPTDVRQRAECMSWLMWQVGTAPYLGGGFGHFYQYAPISIQYAVDRFTMEAKRIVDVLDRHLADGNKTYVLGDQYSLADIAIYPWICCLSDGYNAAKFLSLHEYAHVNRWIGTIAARPAVKRGMIVNTSTLKERHSPNDFSSANL